MTYVHILVEHGSQVKVIAAYASLEEAQAAMKRLYELRNTGPLLIQAAPYYKEVL